MNSDLEDDLRRIIDAWGSEQALHEFLDNEARTLTLSICGPETEVPDVQVLPSFLANGLLGGGRRRSGEYQPPSGDNVALISLFPSACENKELSRIALAHELIHHWEITASATAADLPYPQNADFLIGTLFPNPTHERRWREAHSRRFVGKAAVVAEMLDISLERMLVHR